MGMTDANEKGIRDETIAVSQQDDDARFALNLTDVVSILRERGDQTAYVEQTGGGVATIYAGGVIQVQDGDYLADCSLVLVGPGSFDWTGTEHMADTRDLFVGPDENFLTIDETDRVGFYVPEGAGPEVVADMVEAWVDRARRLWAEQYPDANEVRE